MLVKAEDVLAVGKVVSFGNDREKYDQAKREQGGSPDRYTFCRCRRKVSEDPTFCMIDWPRVLSSPAVPATVSLAPSAVAPTSAQFASGATGDTLPTSLTEPQHSDPFPHAATGPSNTPSEQTWNEFQHSLKGQKMSRKKMSAAFAKHKSFFRRTT